MELEILLLDVTLNIYSSPDLSVDSPSPYLPVYKNFFICQMGQMSCYIKSLVNQMFQNF